IADMCGAWLLGGEMIGRWGKLVNEEGYGGGVRECLLGGELDLADFIVNEMNVEGVLHHATLLYESVWNVLGMVIVVMIGREKFVGGGEVLIG
ncbi:prolipoprotein diacylglyceryl transferase family protein, partial [Paenibacillus sp. Y412MC10]|uniref:prolipoprotein diacylglyceryl transferase family protein n=1 Tax=Geobacillus sp. (strain Y412MC10) TaxID=481743 RepID=UPI001642937E